MSSESSSSKPAKKIINLPVPSLVARGSPGKKKKEDKSNANVDDTLPAHPELLVYWNFDSGWIAHGW